MRAALALLLFAQQIRAAFDLPLKSSLVPIRGTGAPTFTRATTASVFDHENVLRTAKIGEARFTGARRVENLLSFPEAFNNAAWTKPDITATADNTTAPNGTLTADLITEGSAGTAVVSRGASAPVANGATVIVSCNIKRSAVVQWVRLRLVDVTGSDGASLWFDTIAGTVSSTSAVGAGTGMVGAVSVESNGFYRVSLKVTLPAGRTTALVQINSAVAVGSTTRVAGSTYWLWGAQLEDVTGQSVQTVGEYVSANVLSAPYHGCGADGVKCFETLLDGTPIADATLKGFLAEGARTNSIRNNTMVGAVVGTPGTVPTNWYSTISITTGITTSVVGTGIESGINYVDLCIQGTASGAGRWGIGFETITAIAAATGQVWANSLYWKRQAGSLTGLSTPELNQAEWTSGSGYIKSTSVGISLPTNAGLAGQRQAATLTLSGGGTTAFTSPEVRLAIANGADIDITLRIGLPQLELCDATVSSSESSPILTSTVAVTRSSDALSYPNTGNVIDARGTVYLESQLPATNGILGRELGLNPGDNNRAHFYQISGAATTRFGNGSTIIGTGTSALTTARRKKALRWVNGGVGSFFIDGAKLADTASGVQVVNSAIYIGGVNNAVHFYGNIRNVKAWKTAVPDAYLRRLTTL